MRFLRQICGLLVFVLMMGLAQSVFAGHVARNPVSVDAGLSPREQAAQRALIEQNRAELIGAVVGFALSGGDPDNVTASAAIAQSAIRNNYLGHTERVEADALLAELGGLCNGPIGPGPTACYGERAEEIRARLTELQFTSAVNTVDMLEACGADVGSGTCQDHLREARAYVAWSEGFGQTSREYYFDVSAASAGADVDWGGNLDRLAIDVFDQVQSGEIDQARARQEILDRAIGYDGRMNLGFGAGAVVLGVGGCAAAGAGLGCMFVAGGGALLTESNTIYDGAVTVITGQETDGYIQTAFEAAGYSETEAREYERWVEMGLAVATFSIETGAIVLTSRSGQVLRTIDNAPTPPGVGAINNGVPSNWTQLNPAGAQINRPTGFTTYRTPDGDMVHVSPSGLQYGADPKFGNRVDHVLDHTAPNPSKPVHSVFNAQGDDALRIVDDAWVNRTGPGTLQSNGNRTWTVDLGRPIGTNGQTSVQIVVRDGTSEIITAFPK